MHLLCEILLHYFGEHYDDKKSCGHCDNCLQPKEKVEEGAQAMKNKYPSNF